MRLPLRQGRGLHPPSGLYCNIDVSALGVVYFVLLFAVMTLKATNSHGRNVEMPRIGHAVFFPGAMREDIMEVAIFRDGTVFFGVERVNPEDLSARLREGWPQDLSGRFIFAQMHTPSMVLYARFWMESVERE